jgi:hypothetical protein
MSLTSPDFESGAYTNFATPAKNVGEDNKASGFRIANGALSGTNMKRDVRSALTCQCFRLLRPVAAVLDFVCGEALRQVAAESKR